MTTALTWSILAIVLKFGLTYADSYTIVWYRFTVSFLTLLLWYFFTGKTENLRVFKTKPGLLLIAALCLSVNYVGFMQGLHYSSPANVQIFIQLGPLLLTLSGLFIFKEKLNQKQILGLLLCLVGFGLYFTDRMDKIAGNEKNFYIGLSWIVVAAALWAVFASINKHLLNFWKSSQINIYIYLVALMAFFPLVDWQALQKLPLGVHVLYFVLGLNTIVAYGFLNIALKYLPATQVSPILVLNPLLTLGLIALIDFMDWGFIPADPVGTIGYIGAAIAILGIRNVLIKKAPA